MGGCATKPKELKEETDVPLVIDEPKKKFDDIGEKEREEIVKEEAPNRQKEPKESSNQSLDLLLKEMEAKEADQLERKQIAEELETKTTTMIEKEPTTDPKDSTLTTKEESKDSDVDARSSESVVSEESGLPIYSSVKVFF